ncbi:MAG: DUF938 domain-containing protein [Alphaproteobacteria bacterium]|nr:DUF938 domain-containing protein [Alphaproteobacteria bacterium]
MISDNKPNFVAVGDSGRLNAPAAVRNREPILAVLRTVLPAAGTILEIASGSGQHGAWYAAEFPRHRWAPSDIDPEALAGIDAWAREAKSDNILPARLLDAGADDWPLADIGEDLTVMFSANMIHIAPWAAGMGLLAAAGRLLPSHGILFLYGPFLRDGKPATESDAQFDRFLKGRDPSWGLRDFDQVVATAESHGLELSQQVDMPAGNLSLIFRPAVP